MPHRGAAAAAAAAQAPYQPAMCQALGVNAHVRRVAQPRKRMSVSRPHFMALF